MSSFESQIKQAAERNAELRRILSETDYAVPALQEQQRFVKDLEGQATQSDKRRKQLAQKRDMELKDHERYRDSTMKRFLYKAAGKKEKFAAKADKEEREYFEALQESHQEDKMHAGLTEQISEARNAEKQLQQVANTHSTAQQELDSMYNSIFAGPTPRFPEEDNWEQRNGTAMRAYHECRSMWEGEKRALGLLGKAQNHMNRAAGEIESALSYSRMDMFGGGTMTDMMERNHLSAAQQQLMQVNMAVMQASNSSPHIVELPPVRINQGDIMMDVFFDNIFTDYAFHQEIQRGRAEVSRAAAALVTQVDQAKRRHQGLGADLQQKATELDESRRGLQATREQAFDKVVSEQRDRDEPPPSFEQATRETLPPAPAPAPASAPAAETETGSAEAKPHPDEEWWNN